jgi:hypothetical protein
VLVVSFRRPGELEKKRKEREKKEKRGREKLRKDGEVGEGDKES